MAVGKQCFGGRPASISVEMRYQGDMRVYPKVSGLSHNEIYAYNNKQSLRSNIKGYGGNTH
jgi:hypothetical protein